MRKGNYDHLIESMIGLVEDVAPFLGSIRSTSMLEVINRIAERILTTARYTTIAKATYIKLIIIQTIADL